jgi:hypothetical protein
MGDSIALMACSRHLLFTVRYKTLTGRRFSRHLGSLRGENHGQSENTSRDYVSRLGL